MTPAELVAAAQARTLAAFRELEATSERTTSPAYTTYQRREALTRASETLRVIQMQVAALRDSSPGFEAMCDEPAAALAEMQHKVATRLRDLACPGAPTQVN